MTFDDLRNVCASCENVLRVQLAKNETAFTPSVVHQSLVRIAAEKMYEIYGENAALEFLRELARVALEKVNDDQT